MNTVEQTAQMLGRTHELRFDRLMPGYQDKLRQAGNAESTEPKISDSFIKLVVNTCLFMIIIAALLFGAAHFYGSILAKGGNSTSLQIDQISIGDDVINVPENMIRFRSQRNVASLNRLDLYAHWPSMSGYSEERAAIFDSTQSGAPIIFISLEPREMTKDMSGRINSIYENFFAGPPVDAGNGLVRRAFSADSAYFSEDLYYEADSPYPFAARCVRESQNITETFCIRDIHIGRDLTLTYRFHSNLLPQWLSLDNVVRSHFTKMLSL